MLEKFLHNNHIKFFKNKIYRIGTTRINIRYFLPEFRIAFLFIPDKSYHHFRVCANLLTARSLHVFVLPKNYEDTKAPIALLRDFYDAKDLYYKIEASVEKIGIGKELPLKLMKKSPA